MTSGSEHSMHDRVKKSAACRILFLPHAVRQMSKPDRMITAAEVRRIVETGEVIEEYQEDVRGSSCLVFGMCGPRPIHVVCSPRPDYLAIITAYVPERNQWEDGWKVRIRS